MTSQATTRERLVPVDRIKPLSEDEAKDLYRITRFYWKEAGRCEESGAHLAASVFIGAALEAMLMLMVNIYDDKALATRKILTKGGKTADLRRLSLSQLLAVAKAAGWLPSSEQSAGTARRRQVHIGDLAGVIGEVRNLVHPGRYVTDHIGRRVTKRYVDYLFEVLEVSRDWLQHHNMTQLRRKMDAEGLL